MSERKVLNKYYPPDFDPSKIPRMKLPKNRQYTVRLMAPFNMRCVTCGEYIYKGKKFNARKEDVEGEDYLGIRIYRFYIKCTRCLQEISFKTDPRNTDYEIEAGATRNFMALKLAEEQAQREEDERKEDEATNPMKLLENRTKQSKQELELLESLEELRDLNRRQRSVDYDSLLSQFDNRELMKKLEEQQQEEDEKFIRSVFSSGRKKVLEEEIIEDEEEPVQSTSNEVKSTPNEEPPRKIVKTSTPSESSMSPPVSTSVTVSSATSSKPANDKPVDSSWNRSVGTMSSKKGALGGLVRLKKADSSSAAGSVKLPAIENDTSAVRKPSTPIVKLPAVESSSPSIPKPATPSVKLPAIGTPKEPVTTSNSGPSGLSMLGSYSDTDSDET